MIDLLVVAFFLRAKMVDVLPSTRSPVQIVFAGDRMTCEENTKHVTTDGTLNETLSFEVDRRSPSIDGSPTILADDSTNNNNT